jgi:hypothetical protein
LKELLQEVKKGQEVSSASPKKPEGAGEVKKEQLPESQKPEREKQIPEQKVAKTVEEKQVSPVVQKPSEEIPKIKATSFNVAIFILVFISI